MNASQIANLTSPEPVLIVMAKAPRAAQVKTRLCPPLHPEEAASLAAAFLKDAVTRAAGFGLSVLIAYTPADRRAELEEILPSGLLWTPQQGEDLGARMLSAMQAASVQRFSPLVLIGTDSPTIPPSLLASAFELLTADEADMVVGPSKDGGYYLIGLKQPTPGLFDAVAWSTPRALPDTLRNAEALGLHAVQLPQWYDVDTPDDLTRLQAELRSSQAAREYAPFTYQWISNHEDFDNRSYAE